MKKMDVTINGHTYSVEIDDLNTSPLEVFVNGQKYEVVLDDKSAETSGLSTPALPVVNIAAASANSQNNTAPVFSDKALHAPMPGLILDVGVAPGDHVTRGQHLMSLEAMKMKNSIRSPRDGVIAEILVGNGQKVSYNDLLLNFE